VVVVEAMPCRNDEVLTIDVHSDIFRKSLEMNLGSKMKVTSASLASKSHLQFSFSARERSKCEPARVLMGFDIVTGDYRRGGNNMLLII
jgi:hypothetical protein